jgi:LmbE family N-acetylglucosaminyl deacetylase
MVYTCDMPELSTFDSGFRTVAVVSPHFDAGVFSCGDLLASHPGSTVITVFGSGPLTWGKPTPWDASAGFDSGQDAVAARRAEDRGALAALEAQPVWLPFWESQYGRTVTAAEIETALESVITATRPDAVCIPLGLWHTDHRLTHEAGVALLARHPSIAWLAYEDAIYRRFRDAGVMERLAQLASHGIRPVRIRQRRDISAEKLRAISCYRSQLRAFASPGHPGVADALKPEAYWQLVPRAERA